MPIGKTLRALWKEKIRRLLPPVISSFLCFVFVVVKPLSDLGGEYAFLCYTALLLFCFPGGTIGGQLEATILGIFFTVAGLTWSIITLAIAAHCGRTYGADGPEARTILGVGLALLAFVAGFIRSYSPRLTLASRIGLFFPVFLLTGEQAVTQVTSRHFLPMFYITLFAAAFGLLPLLVLSHRSSGPLLGSTILSTLSTIHDLLPLSLSTHLCDEVENPTPPAWHTHKTTNTSPSREYECLAKSLKSSIGQISPLLKSFSTEIVHSRLPPTHLRSTITALKAVARNPLLGAASHTPGERIQAALLRVGMSPSQPTSALGTPRRGRSIPRHGEGGRFAHELEKRLDSVPAYLRAEAGLGPHRRDHTPSPSITPDTRLSERWTELSRCICSSTQVVALRLANAWDWETSLPSTERTDTEIRTDLVNAISAFETDLERALDPDEGYSRALSGSRTPVRSREWRNSLITHGDRDNFRLAFYMVSLLDLGRDTLKLLDVVLEVTKTAPEQKSWYVPYLSRWIKSTASVKPIDVLDDHAVTDVEMDQLATANDHASDPTGDLDFIQAALRREHHARLESRGRSDIVRLLWRSVWDNHRSLRCRVAVSRFMHSSRHSRHTIFGFKLSLGIALLSLPAFLPPGTPGRVWFEDVRANWMIASYLYVLEVHTGAIFRVGVFRILGTLVGAVAGYVCTLIARDNPYALVTLATVCSIPITYIILFTTFPGVGTVAGITLPPLLFINYLDLSMGFDTIYFAYNRFINITIGIVAAVLVGTLIWPDHARVKYFSAVSITLDRLTEYYVQLSRDNLRSTLVYQLDQKVYSSLDNSVKREINAARTLVAVQRNEISLLPRPIRLYSEVLDAAERFIDTLIEIRLLRFSVPRKETVLDVITIRSEFVSAVLINLWACSQAFRSRSPLPQFLPNPRTALEELMLTVDEQKREGRRRRKSGIQPGSEPLVSAKGEGGDSGRGGRGKGQLAMLYAMAEHEALGELCNLIDELVAAARTLFGSQTFLDTAIRYPIPD